jgi:hypothetical protein
MQIEVCLGEKGWGQISTFEGDFTFLEDFHSGESSLSTPYFYRSLHQVYLIDFLWFARNGFLRAVVITLVN